MPALHKPKTFNYGTGNFAAEDMLDRLSARDAFYNDMATCPLVIFQENIPGGNTPNWHFVMFTAGYPICVAFEVGEVSPWVNNPPEFHSELWHGRDWKTAVYVVGTGLISTSDNFINTYLEDTYGRDRLIYPNITYTWMHYLAVTDNDLVINIPYLIWNRYQQLLGVYYQESRASVSLRYYSYEPFVFDSSLEVDNLDLLSSAAWPELPGYNTQYLDNIGIFVPADYTVNQVLTQLIIKYLAENGHTVEAALMQRVAVLDKATPYASATDVAHYDAAHLFEAIPGVGNALSFLEQMTVYMNQKTERMLWPRVYAFGRQEGRRVPSPMEMTNLHAILKNSQTQFKTPVILGVNESLFKTMVDLLVGKGYVDEQLVGDWLSM